MNDLILSLAVLASFALLGGAFYLWRKQGANRQSLLMAIMAVVLMANVLIWAAPMPGPAGAGAAEGTGTAAAERE
jgi:hypothetical protein